MFYRCLDFLTLSAPGKEVGLTYPQSSTVQLYRVVNPF